LGQLVQVQKQKKLNLDNFWTNTRHGKNSFELTTKDILGGSYSLHKSNCSTKSSSVSHVTSVMFKHERHDWGDVADSEMKSS